MALVRSRCINLKNVLKTYRNISFDKNIIGRRQPNHYWGKLGISLTVLSLGGSTFYFTRPVKERRFISVTIGGIGRFFRSSYIASRISLKYIWSTYGISEDDPKYVEIIEQVHKESAELILKGCLQNGGLYVKLGQGLVIMDHILPKEYIETLRVLQDKCLVRQPGEVYQLFLEDFGIPVNEIFDDFNDIPIAAASLAQVFKGKTKDGKQVAIKAQYIDLQDRFVGDVATLTILLKIAAWLHPDFDFAWVLNELKGTLEKELNFLNEGKNSEQCAKDLEHFPFVYVPEVIWKLSSTRVLTTEWIDGIKISDAERLKKHGFSLADIDYKLFKTFSEQIFHTGFVHADPHPGNILVRKGSDKKAQLVLLDHGLYEKVPDNVRESLRQLWKVMVLNDHEGMKKYSVELGVDEKDYRLFCIALGQRYIPSPDPMESDEDIIRLFFARRTTDFNPRRLTKKEKARIEMEIIALRNRCLNVFKAIPSKLMLVTRNINTIRSIARGHGDPINRYKVMARCATQGTFLTGSTSSSIFTNLLRKMQERMYFEIKLWWGGIKVWFVTNLVKMVEIFGGTNVHGLSH